MKTLKATTFAAGTVLALSEHQAAARRHALKPLGRGRYEAIVAIQFKAGEEIGLDGELPKTLADSVDSGKKQRRAVPPKVEATTLVPEPDSADSLHVE